MKLKSAALGLLLIVVPATSAIAGTIQITWNFPYAATYKVQGGPSGSTAVGDWTLTVIDGTGLGLTTGQMFDTYCVDLNHYIYTNGTKVGTGVDLMSNWYQPDPTIWPSYSSPNAGQVAAYLYLTFSPVATTAAQQAALQLAIWEVLYENKQAGVPFDVSTGTATFTTPGNLAIIQTANNYLSTIPTDVSGYDAIWFRTDNGPGNTMQDYIGPTPVPEPGSLFLLGSGLIGLAVVTRLKARSQ